MSRPDLSGKDIIKVLTKFNYTKVRQKGSHVVLKYRHPDTEEIRTVTVPLHDSLKTGTLTALLNKLEPTTCTSSLIG